MTLDKIVSISKRPGLFELITQTRNGIVARSLVDGKTITVNMNSQISVLSEIQVFCLENEIPLTAIFDKMLQFEKGVQARVAPKAAAIDLEAYFFEVVPEYDEDRVYPSDIKKIIQWYNILLSKEILKRESEEKKPAKKTASKKTAKAETPNSEEA